VTRAALFAKAVAFNTTKDPRHLAGLHQAEIETVLSMASMLRDGYRQAVILSTFARPGLQVPPRRFDGMSPMEANRYRRDFWADQHATPRTLP